MDECLDKRAGAAGSGFELRMEKRRDVETVMGKLQRANVAALPRAGNAQPRSFESRQILGVHTVVTEVTGFNRFHTIDGAEPGPGP